MFVIVLNAVQQWKRVNRLNQQGKRWIKLLFK